MNDDEKVIVLLGGAIGFECELIRVIGGLWQIQPMERDPYHETNVFFRWTLKYHREDQYHPTVVSAAYNFAKMFEEFVRRGKPDVFTEGK